MSRFSVVRHCLVLTGAACVAATAAAQPEPAVGVVSDNVFFISNMSPVMSFGGMVDVVGPEGNVQGAVVVGKPYSADAITESTQILADGNRITQRNETRLYRDGQGRTRREQVLGGVGPWATARDPVAMITINDPVAEVTYFLDPAARTARQLRRFKMAAGAQATWNVAVPPPPAGEPGVANVTIMRDVRIAEPASDTAATDGAVANALPPPPALALAPFTAARAVPFATSVTAATEDLGEQVLEGVMTRGSRQTHTIAAGAMGNERPIEIVAEQWYSAEIEALVLRRHYDPRFGESTYRLVNLVRGEPSPDLFTVPSGYEIQSPDAGGPAFGVGGQVAPAEPRAGQRVFLLPPRNAAPTRD